MAERVVDARGLSCPQPVILTLNEIKREDKGEITVLVDNETARENVSRAGKSQGWQVEAVQLDGENCRLTMRKEVSGV